MPKTDYSNTVIYEIKCKDPLVKYSEIGATTNLSVLRHRFFKNKLESKFPKLNYQVVANGGIENWEVNILEEYDLCSSKNDSNKRVKQWKNHKLGLYQCKIVDKIVDIDPLACKHCFVSFANKSSLKRHMSRCKVLKQSLQNDTSKTADKNIDIDPLACKYCNFSFANKSSLKRHMPRCKVLEQLKDTANIACKEAKIAYKEAKIAYKEAKKKKAKIDEEYNQIHDCS
tara:strand:- start:628 stop:1311 length:684 start_codon:yes stop_codon:yes gene_type:complete